MATFLDTVRYNTVPGLKAVAYGEHGVMQTTLNKGVKYGAAWGFGALKGSQREKALIGGKVPVDLAVGLGASVLGALTDAWSGGGSRIAPFLHSVGDAGVMSYLNSIGTAWGARQSGRAVYVLDQGATPPAQLPSGMTRVEGIPQAVGGAYLTDADLASSGQPR